MQYIIGDIHANIKELDTLLQHLHLRKGDTLIFLGDYIDKCPYTQETLSCLSDLDQKYACVFLKGNHEFVWEEYIRTKAGERRQFLLQKGGKEALQNYTEDVQQALDENNIPLLQKTLQPYVQLIAKTKDWHIVDGYLALHAGLLEEQYTQKKLVFQERNFFLRPQEIPQKKKYLNQCVLVAGHTYMGDSPTIEKGYINIDLGAGYGKHIGALSVTEHKIIRSDGTAFYIDSSTK